VKLAVGLLVLVAVLMLLRADPGERRAAGRAAALAAVVVVPPVLLALAGLDYLVARNLIVAWLPAAVVVGLGAAGRRAGRPGAIVAVALVGLLGAVTIATSLEPALGREDWRGLATELARPPQPQAIAVMPAHEERSLRQYLPGVRPVRGEAPVRELVVVQTTRAGRQPTPPPPPGFRLVGRRERQRLTVIRYRSVGPHGRVGPADLAPGGARASLFLQPGQAG
jgi:hypothetical protein